MQKSLNKVTLWFIIDLRPESGFVCFTGIQDVGQLGIENCGADSRYSTGGSREEVPIMKGEFIQIMTVDLSVHFSWLLQLVFNMPVPPASIGWILFMSTASSLNHEYLSLFGLDYWT